MTTENTITPTPKRKSRLALTKQALTDKPRQRDTDQLTDPDQVESHVAYAQRAFEEAHALGVENKLRPHNVQNLAVQAWKNCFPILSSRTAARAYIALVAQGLAHSWIDPEEARVMMYTAQTALTVLAKRGRP